MNGVLGYFLCTYRLNWAKKTTWGWWDEWGEARKLNNLNFHTPEVESPDTATHNSKLVKLTDIYWSWDQTFVNVDV